MTPADLTAKGFIETADGTFEKPTRKQISHGPELLTSKHVVSKTGTSHVCDSTMSKSGGDANIPREAALNFQNENNRQTSAPVMERRSSDAALGASQAQTGDSGRFLVVITSFRRRLLDEDNLCEKYHVDCCRYAGLLPSDAPDTTKIEVRQQKVKSKDDERTEIEITPKG